VGEAPIYVCDLDGALLRSDATLRASLPAMAWTGWSTPASPWRLLVLVARRGCVPCSRRGMLDRHL